MLKKYPGNFWLLSMSSFLFFASFTMLIPELPAYLSRMGGKEYLGLIISLFTLTAGISRPFSGKLTDRWGRVPVMVVGAVVSGLAAMMYPLLASVSGFLFIRLFHGFSAGFKPTATSAYIADIIPSNRRGEALGISSFFGSVGMTSGLGVGPTIALHYGINALFFLSAATAFASVAILVGMKETLINTEKFHPRLLRVKRSEIFEPAVFTPSIVMILTTLAFGTVITLSPDFSDHLGIKNRGLFYVVFTSSSLLVRVIGGKLSDRFGRKSVLKFSTSILFVSMMIIGFSHTPTLFFTGAFFFGIGYGLNSPTLFAWTIDLSPEVSRGRGVATLFIFLEVGIGIGAFVSGTVYQGMADRFPWIFASAGIFSLAAFLYLQFFNKK